MSLLPPLAHHKNGAVGVADHRVGDASHKRPPNSAQASATHDHEVCSYLLCNPHDFVRRVPLRRPHMLAIDLPSALLDSICLIVEYILSSLTEVLDESWFANVIVRRIRSCDAHEV